MGQGDVCSTINCKKNRLELSFRKIQEGEFIEYNIYFMKIIYKPYVFHISIVEGRC